MKTRMQRIIRTVAIAALVIGANVHPAHAVLLSTAFTYQGQLTDGGGPANGTYDLRFILYDGSVVTTPALAWADTPIGGSRRWRR
jgi:hypothetical protein